MFAMCKISINKNLEGSLAFFEKNTIFDMFYAFHTV